MGIIYNSNDAISAMFGQKARSQPSVFGEIIDYGSSMAKVIGGVMEGPRRMDGRCRHGRRDD